mmetsp:Transcript_78223/g.209138  ORF Transcript_78223/g.209138 Transcript_78223/m.209138 type:complete len:84 (+) Transcript_78223:106-357(+)
MPFWVTKSKLLRFLEMMKMLGTLRAGEQQAGRLCLLACHGWVVRASGICVCARCRCGYLFLCWVLQCRIFFGNAQCFDLVVVA